MIFSRGHDCEAGRTDKTLTIVLGGYGLESSDKLCMVANFHSETILWMRDTFSSYRDGRLFCRDGIRGGRIWGKELCCRNLRRFTGLLVKWTDCTTRAAGGEVRFVLSWLDISSGRQAVLIHLRKWTSDLYLQIKRFKKWSKSLQNNPLPETLHASAQTSPVSMKQNQYSEYSGWFDCLSRILAVGLVAEVGLRSSVTLFWKVEQTFLVQKLKFVCC